MTFKKIRIVTDSTCDIPTDLLHKHHITSVPCYVNYGGSSYADDGVQLVREEYYKQLGSMRPFPTTAAMPPAQAETMIKAAAEDADHIIIITVPAKLSGVYNTMRLAALSSLPADRYTLIDSGQVTMGLGWQVVIGSEVAEATGSVQAVIDAMQRVRENQKVYAALSTMDFLRAGGRVSWTAASIGALLQIKPIVEVLNGEVKSHARVRTFNRAVEELIEQAHKQVPLDRLAILHTNNHAGAESLLQHLADIAPAYTLIVNITPTIGTHIGPGGLGIATVSETWRTGNDYAIGTGNTGQDPQA